MRHVIVGNGAAGVTAAAELVKNQSGTWQGQAPARQGRAPTVTVFSKEPYHYYYRSQLPNFIAGEAALENMYAYSPEWYSSRGITVRLNQTVTRIVPAEKKIVTSDNTEVPYDTLLLATGADSIVPPFTGRMAPGPAGPLAGVFTLRTLDNAYAIIDYAAGKKNAVVIGGGLLGLETARALRRRGLNVSVLEAASRLLPLQLDPAGAEIFQRLIGHTVGLNIILNADAAAISGNSRVERVILRDGREFPADLVVITAGSRSSALIAENAGLNVNQGIVVDHYMRTSVPGIFAAGDCAEYSHTCGSIVPTAISQARIAAASMMDKVIAYQDIPPSRTLNIAGLDLTSTGTVFPETSEHLELVKADIEARTYRKLVMKNGTVIGAIVIGDKLLARKLERLCHQRAELTREQAVGLLH